MLDALARTSAFAACLGLARMAQMLAAKGALSEKEIEELRITTLNPFDWSATGLRQPNPQEAGELERQRELLDAEWHDACRRARHPEA